jgi:hypothetical protein
LSTIAADEDEAGSEGANQDIVVAASAAAVDEVETVAENEESVENEENGESVESEESEEVVHAAVDIGPVDAVISCGFEASQLTSSGRRIPESHREDNRTDRHGVYTQHSQN